MEVDEDTLDDRMRERITAGAQNLRSDAFVKVSDAHLEAKARFCLFDSLALCGSHLKGDRERSRARGFSVRPPLRHRQLQRRAGYVHPTAKGLQKSSVITAIVFQTVLEILFLAIGHDDEAEHILVQPAQGSL